MNLLFKERLQDKEHESLIFNDINKKDFFNWMDLCGFNCERICEVFDSKRISGYEQNEFNTALRNAKIELNIDLIDSILYLEEYAIKFRKIISMLDNQTTYMLKKELSEKFRIEIDTNNLSKMFEDDDEK